MGKQFKKGVGEMEEAAKKEDEIKKEETDDKTSNYWKSAPWARCPFCDTVWDSSDVQYSFWYFDGRPIDVGPAPIDLPEKPCPDHAKEIVAVDVDGRRKGIKRTLCQEQLHDMRSNDLYCPFCRGKDLRWLCGCNEEHLNPGLHEEACECKQCHALILFKLRFTSSDKNEVGWLVSVSYREDLKTKKELNEAWNIICRIINSGSFGFGVGTPIYKVEKEASCKWLLKRG
jgi:hypothetical protein